LGGKKQASKIIFFAVSKILFTFAPANQIFLPFQGVWFLLRRVKRLGSAKPWQPILRLGKRCQNLIPESREMIKIKHGYHEFDLSFTHQLYYSVHAYAHVQVIALICIHSLS